MPVGAIGLQQPGIRAVLEIELQVLAQRGMQRRIEHRKGHLHAVEEVALHPVRTAEIHLGLDVHEIFMQLTSLTRTPNGAASLASDLVNVMSPPFAVA